MTDEEDEAGLDADEPDEPAGGAGDVGPDAPEVPAERDEPDEDAAPPPEDETVQVQADESPSEAPDEPPAGETGTTRAPETPPPAGDGPEDGLEGLLYRAGDRLAYAGDRWEARLKDAPHRAPTPPPPPVFVGTFTFLGEEVPWNMHEWGPRERRAGCLLASGLAAALVVLGILTELFASSTVFLTILLVGVVVAMAFELAVFLTAEAPPEPRPAPAGGAAAAGTREREVVEPPAGEPDEEREPLDVLTLKCGECGEVFDVEDHGERPLTHSCPGCGADGEIPTDELPDPADLRDEPDEAPGEPEAPAGEIPEETADPIPEFDLDDEDADEDADEGAGDDRG